MHRVSLVGHLLVEACEVVQQQRGTLGLGQRGDQLLRALLALVQDIYICQFLQQFFI